MNTKTIINYLWIAITLATVMPLPAMKKEKKQKEVVQSFFEAIEGGDLQRVNASIDSDRSLVDAQDSIGRSALMRAIETDQNQIAETLITQCAAINEPNEHGVTPLMRAAAKENESIMQTLIKAGAAWGTRSKHGESVDTIIERKHPDIAQKLKVALTRALAALGITRKVEKGVEIIFAEV